MFALMLREVQTVLSQEGPVLRLKADVLGELFAGKNNAFLWLSICMLDQCLPNSESYLVFLMFWYKVELFNQIVFGTFWICFDTTETVCYKW